MKNKTTLSIFIALLFHVSGLVGMMTSYKPWFISMTPVTLLLMFVLLMWTEQKTSYAFYLTAFFISIIGLLVEVIGVNTAYLFGHYTYGAVMGIKLYGVPLLMGIQWLVTIVCSAHLLRYVLNKSKFDLQKPLFALVAALITTSYDIVIEPIAMEFDYWNWVNDIVPLFNYVCWFLISFLIHFLYATFSKIEKTNYYAAALIVIQALFFLILNVVV